ncbi:methyltransferase domain-containing protein [candidate division KSB1 bacterium]|nr:methyltransferase domain-containing protein [candidate division KSB1 bacterium]NIV70984.1 methyltransferase domain-containing protein [Phycisphaerae bacterium]NIR73114.1 methyltransferase domain-containing protein [candidate division KSB1 bacterium]NIT75208.1 methyltransferase domain-containing protein [candidate division KSB1 bacterium]NIU29047.1 methyltransferase domain-containing protein [candidate division KSB1 bacterium]
MLELACGTGLLLFRVAPRCEKYVGTDFSEVGLNYVRQQLARPELHMPQVSLMQRMADNFEGIEPNSFDLVILHSVVQLFPGVDYLMRVLEGAVNAVQPSGFVYIGDVISLPLMETFHTSVQLYQAPSWTSREQLRQRIKKARSKEEQLFIDPAFFSALKQHLPQITHAQIQLRRGRHLNEMTRFRYDVILQVGSEPHSNPEIQWLDWQQAGLSVPGLKRLLADTQPEFLGIKGVPNARLAADMEAVELLANSDGPETVGQLRETLSQLSSNGFVDPEELWAIGDELPYDVYVTWSGYSSDGMYDVQFVQKTLDDSSPKLAPAFFDEGVSPKPWNNYANNPLQSVYARQLVPELRTYLQKKLPDYMVPSAFVLLDALPLSPNGKVDRRALPLPDESRPELTADFAPPRNPLEEVVASIWAEVFEFEKVGIHDNFLEMGGHSLLAIQIMTRLQDNFPVELPLRYLFASPTVAKLSQRIQVAGQEAQVDVVEVARALIQINQLSDDEVKSMLAASEEKL